MLWELVTGPNGAYYRNTITGDEVAVRRSKATIDAARAIMSAAAYCPSAADPEGYRAYQDQVMQTLRDRLSECVKADRAATSASLPHPWDDAAIAQIIHLAENDAA